MSIRHRPFTATFLLGCAFISPIVTTSFLAPAATSHPCRRDPRRPRRRPRYHDDGDDGDDERTAPAPPSSSSRLSSSRSSVGGGDGGGIYGAVHRKEHEMKRLSAQHASLSDPVRMAMSYSQDGIEKKRLAAALRRVHDDPENVANPEARRRTAEEVERGERMLENGVVESTMRRGSFVVDVKRRSGLSYPGEQFARYDDAGAVAEAMVRLGADVVLVNVDYHSYGGDMAELKSAVRAVRAVNDRAAVVMKDIVVDELQLGLAKEAGADGIVLCATVLGPALENFLNLATVIGLETIVECHTYNEVRAALDALAQNIMVTNRDRITGELVMDQAIKLAGMFPGSGGPIVTMAGGGITNTDQMKKLLAVGYDGVVVGRAVMGSARAPEFIRAVRDRTLLPAEFSQWGLDGFEFDMDGNVMSGPKTDVPRPGDADVFL
jgi:indole-3-glycerol phosphate synthase